MSSSSPAARSGLWLAIGSYLIWGLLPLYLQYLRGVPPFEFVGWRIIFTLPVCLIIVAFRRQAPQLIAALRDHRALKALAISSLLIGVNWLVYVAGIQAGHFFAVSMGYYINPLVNVLLGTLFLGERLSTRQWTAVVIAAIGVSLLAWDAREMLGIGLALALSFSGYGLVRKIAPVGSLPGLTIETFVLILPAIGLVLTQFGRPASMEFQIGADAVTSGLLAFSGVVTAVPLLMFAVAARRMDYSTMGFIQFLTPTMVFLLGLFVFHEPLRDIQLACFVLIWSAIGLFSWDLFARRRA